MLRDPEVTMRYFADLATSPQFDPLLDEISRASARPPSGDGDITPKTIELGTSTKGMLGI